MDLERKSQSTKSKSSSMSNSNENRRFLHRSNHSIARKGFVFAGKALVKQLSIKTSQDAFYQYELYNDFSEPTYTPEVVRAMPARIVLSDWHLQQVLQSDVPKNELGRLFPGDLTSQCPKPR